MRLPHQQRRILIGLLIGVIGSVPAQERQVAPGPQKTPAISASFVKVQGAGVSVSGYLAKPPGGSGLPAVLLVPGASNLGGPVLQTVRDMAAEGFVALAVDYDPDRVLQQSDLVRSVAEDQLSLRLAAAADWLTRQRPLVDPQRIGAIGWGAGSSRVLELGQHGQVGTGVMIESEPCHAPQNLPPAPVARMLLVVGGCTPDRGQGVKASAGIGAAYQIRTFEGPVESAPAWNEIYKFLKEPNASGNPAPEVSAASSNSVATIRDIMRVINSDDGVRGKLAALLAVPPGDVQWDQARSHAAILVESCDWLLARRPPKGSIAGWRGRVADYRAATQALLHAVEQRDLPAAQQALGRLPQSCAACHLDYR